MRTGRSGAIVVVVTDSSPLPLVMCGPGADAEHGHGLRVVNAYSTRWGWIPQAPGKAVFAVFAKEG